MSNVITVQIGQEQQRLVCCCTQQMRAAYRAYLRSNVETLESVYKSYSDAKRKAYKHCRELFKAMDGYNFAIVSANPNVFTVGFYFNRDGDRCFTWVTRDNARFCPVADLMEWRS